MKFAILLTAAALTCSGTMAFADGKCRFIDKKIEREACYVRQDEERAAKLKANETARKATAASPPLTEDDRAIFRTLHSICRGC